MQRVTLPHARLRTRIIAWSFIPTTLILLAIALVIFYAYQKVTEDLVAGRNGEVTRLSASQLSSDLTEYTSLLSSVALRSDVRSAVPETQQAALVAISDSLIVFDGGILILDSHGQVVAAQPPRPDALNQDWSNRTYFRDMLRAKGPVFSDMTNDAPGGAEGIVVAVPIMGDRGELRGVLTGIFRLGTTSLNAFYGGIVKLRIGENGSSYLVDSGGRIIYHSSVELVGTDARALPAVQQVLAQQVGNLRTRDVKGRDILASFAPIPGTPWGLVIEEDWSRLMSAASGYEQFLVVLLALGVVVPTLVVTFGVKRITDPITELIRAAQEIAGGKFGQEIKVTTGDELEELAGQFNLMSRELRESYGQLEQRVAERTQALAALNAVSAVISGSLDLKEILQAALNKAMETMHMETGTAYSLQDAEGPDEDKYLVLAARQGMSDDFVERVGPRRLAGTAIQIAAAAQQPRVWLVKDYPDLGVKEALELEGVRQVVNIPLIAKGNLVGAFNLGTRNERSVSPEEISLLASIGHQIALAVENARLYDQAEQTAALAERNRLSRELHDSVTQSLYSVTLYAEATARLLDMGEVATAAQQLRELRDTSQEALREMRLLIFQLRPSTLRKSGLAGAIQERLDAVERRGGIQSRLRVEGQEHLPVAVQEELYHIAQEALTNTLKHAQAHQVQIDLSFADSSTCLEIADDGAGFVPAAALNHGGLGLRGMQERVQRIGGKLEISSAPGKGTRVRVEIAGTEGTDSIF